MILFVSFGSSVGCFVWIWVLAAEFVCVTLWLATGGLAPLIAGSAVGLGAIAFGAVQLADRAAGKRQRMAEESRVCIEERDLDRPGPQ